jgi:HK97 family phage major capsid protein
MMKTNIMELRRQRAAVLDGAQAIMDKATGENRALSEDEERQVGEAKTAADTLLRQEQLAETIGDMRGAVPATQAAMVNRGKLGDNEANAWKAYLRDNDRGGLDHLLAPGEKAGERPQIVLHVPSQRQTRVEMEQRVTDSTMNITTSGDGANLVPTGLVAQIATRKNERMLAERLGCRRVPGQGTTVNYPYENKDPDVFAATSEQSDAHGNNYERNAFTTALRVFTLVKYTRKLELTEEMLEDTPVDLMGYIADVLGREIAATHNALLVANAEALGTKLKDFASNAAIAAGELEAIIGNDALGFYLEDGSDVHWLMRSTTHWAINSVTGDSRFYSAQLPGLLGHDVIHSTKVDAIGAAGKSVFFGDWNYMGYREAPELRFIQDPYSVDGVVVLKYSFRACYGLLQAGALGYGLHP